MNPHAEPPRGEVEILPPDETNTERLSRERFARAFGPSAFGPSAFGEGAFGEGARVKIVRLGPVTGALMFAFGLLVVGGLLALFTSAFLVLFPIGLLLGAAAMIGGAFTGTNPFRRLK